MSRDEMRQLSAVITEITRAKLVEMGCAFREPENDEVSESGELPETE